MIIKLKDYEVKIKDVFLWGDKERIQNIYVKGANIDQTGIKGFDTSVISEARYTLLEIAILEIKKGDEIIQFSKEWMYNLPIEDGDKLYNEIDIIFEKKK
jgi:hypothetical protein